tara:strand:- start:808 stop:2865 length:2058 start_codon:yes stop_codon:yes gene_type:complete
MKSFTSLLAGGLMTALLTPAAQTANARDYSTETAKGKVAVSSHLLEQLDNSALRTRSVGATEESVMADLVLNSTTGLEQALTALGVKVLLISDKYQRASVRLSSSEQAAAVAALPQVTRVNAEYGAVKRAGSVTSRAARAMNGDLLSSLPAGLTGAGQKVGIISDSFAHTSGVRDSSTTPALCASGTLRHTINQDSGDLPEEIDLRSDNNGDDCANPGTDEGAAMAELVHDIAPDAEVAFASMGGSLVAFATAIDDLCTPESEGGAGSTVVVDDIIFLAQLLYQNDIVAQAARDCVASGVPYFSAAGNEGDAAISATYTDVSPSVRSSAASLDDAHDWGGGDPYLAVTIPAGEEFSAVLHWNQPATQASIDLDLFLLNSESELSDGSIVTGSAEAQDGTTESAAPVEVFSYTNETASAQTLYLVVDQFKTDGSSFLEPDTTIPQASSEPLIFRLSFYRSSDDISIAASFNASTMYGHTNAPGVMAVGAVPWLDTVPYDPTFLPSAVTDPESFSALGGAALERQFDDNGNFAKETYRVPALAAVDGNNTTFFGDDLNLGEFNEPDGFPNFFGTSAAAPNAAAVAALLMQAGGDSMTPDLLADVMTSTATDIVGERAAVGWDPVTGAGLIDAQAAYDDLYERLGGDVIAGDLKPKVLSGKSSSGSTLWLLLLTPALVLLRQRKRKRA